VSRCAGLYTLITGADPRQLKFAFAVWTRDMVRELIRREFRVSLSAVSVGRALLRTLGLSPHRPLWRAWQADPDAVQRWSDEEFPAIRKQAKADGATIYFGDEAGIRSPYHAGTTRAPVGQTPTIKVTRARNSLNMISAVTARGLLRFSRYTDSLTSARFSELRHKLLADTEGPGLTGRRRTDDKFKLFVLPAYSPQLNPDEWVWEERQARPRRATSVTRPDDFKAKIIGGAAANAEDAARCPRVTRRSRPLLHHRMTESANERSA
jgi:hypothetical protein